VPRVAERVVVGAAILDGAGRVLVAQRSEPPALAGYWELPGGKVDPGESDRAALVRECREELGVALEVIERLGADLPIGSHGVLRVYAARVTDGEPQAFEHAALRWLGADELDALDWLPADRPLVPALQALLRAP
jgi:8-oxo-dGTP diphosphatase